MKELLALLLLGGGAYYALRPSRAAASAPAPTWKMKPVSTSTRPKGKGPWAQKEGGCSSSGCTIGWENTRLKKTGWADSKVTREAYDTLPDRVASLAALKKRKGVLSVKKEAA